MFLNVPDKNKKKETRNTRERNIMKEADTGRNSQTRKSKTKGRNGMKRVAQLESTPLVTHSFIHSQRKRSVCHSHAHTCLFILLVHFNPMCLSNFTRHRFDALGFQLASVFYGVFMRLYATYLPTTTLLRVWDLLFAQSSDATVRGSVGQTFSIKGCLSCSHLPCHCAQELRNSS